MKGLFQSLLLLAVIGASLVLLGLPRFTGLADNFVEERWESLKAENRALEAENMRLRKQVEALRNDLEVLDKVAREELGYIREGEVLVVLSE